MGIDVEKCVSNTQHLREDWKQQMIHTIRQIRKIRMTDLKMDRDEVKWMRVVGRRYKYLLGQILYATHYYLRPFHSTSLMSAHILPSMHSNQKKQQKYARIKDKPERR